MPMGRGRKGTGVELRPGSIRVKFTWNGERCVETLPDTKPTIPNKRAAETMMREIYSLIDLGRFTIEDYARYFPRAGRVKDAQAARAGTETFGAFADLYLAGRSDLAKATLSQYGNELARWKERIGAHRPMASIVHSWLKAEVGKVAFPSARMRNNSLIALRGTFDLWVADKPRERVNPMDGIGNAKVQRKKKDPFDLDEVEAILADMHAHYPPAVAFYFEFAFFAGMRPEEQIALLWSKIDWQRGRARVDAVRTFKGSDIGTTKTFVERDVELSERALKALTAMRPLTQLKKHGHVFEHPELEDSEGNLGKPWHDERSQRDRYWKPSLARCKVRYRTAYKTRSTYITMNIMEGANAVWVAEQAGHSVAQLWRDYAEWINAADRGRERRKLDDALRRRAAEREEKAG